jgi:hypothetical protein
VKWPSVIHWFILPVDEILAEVLDLDLSVVRGSEGEVCNVVNAIDSLQALK